MRLRMKVWTDPDTNERYLCPAAIMKRDDGWASGIPTMRVYAMNDENTKVLEMSPEEWDRLPFFYFKEDGECVLEERPKRPFDVL